MDEKFKPLTATPIVDPSKHVNYSYGMVLGVDDFTQEFVYHSERDQWMTRDIDGYGTVSGLRVTLAENANGEREVIVSAGTAVNPRGQMICVPAAQCAVIDRWLAVEANRKGAEKKAAESPGAPLGLYVVLCYRDCPTDKVPVPGEPCRSEDETVANSRLKDDFRLELRLTPPAQAEELAVREFVRCLCEHVEFTDDEGGPADLDSLVEALRGYAEAAYPSSPPDYVEDSPPFALRVPSELRCEFLRAALRVWVTEVRPRFRPDLPGAHCSPCAGGEGAAQGGDADCVLLAELRVFLTPDTLVDDAREVRLVEAQRPVLVHQRMLQEFLLCGSCCACGGGESQPQAPAPPAALALDDLSDVNAPDPQPNDLLTFSGGQWIAAPVVDAIEPGDAAGGDLAATYPNPTVAGLQKRPVSDAAPNPGDVLTWDGSRWQPSAPAARPLLPFVTIAEGSSDKGFAFFLWFHLDAPNNGAEISKFSPKAMSVFAENADAKAGFVEPVTILDLAPLPGGRNVFRCEIEKSRSTLYRFVFDLRNIGVGFNKRAGVLLDYMQRRGLNFVGFDGESSVTEFFVGGLRRQVQADVGENNE